MAEVGRENDKISRSFCQARSGDPLVALATHQHGVIALSQLRELGLSSRAIQHRAKQGRLHRIYRRVYALVPRKLLKREGRYMAAVLAAGPGSVLSHRDAAVLHGLITNNRSTIEVTVPGRAVRRHAGIEIHRSKTLTAADVTRINNIPCTSLARTLIDLADVVDRRRHERAFDQAEIEEKLDLNAIRDQLQRNPTRSAAKKVRALLGEHYIGSTPTESELEEAFLALCRRAGLPRPEVQVWLQLPDGEPPIRVDFLWREQRVVVETDGERYHRTRQASRRDARKDQRLIGHGLKPVRTSWRQIFFYADELEATLKALLLS